MPQISIQGKSIHFQEGEKFEKSRPTLLFVHGAGQRAYTWRFQEDLFRNHPKFNYMALDLPGRAGSEGEGFHTLEEYKNFLLEFIDALELNNIILVGHSMGGGISMLLAIEHPELVEALILVATSAKLSVASETLEKVKDNYEEFYEISPTRAFAEESPKELKDEYQQGLIDTGSAVCYGDLMACNVFDIMKEVEKIHLPTLIISADKDIMTPPKYGEYLHQKIYGSEFHVIKGSGHFIMQERTHEFNTILEDFLNDFIE